MIGRMSKKKRHEQNEFHRVHAKLTKADKTKARIESAKNPAKKNAQELSKKNAQEGKEKERGVRKMLDGAANRMSSKKRYSLKRRWAKIAGWQIEYSTKTGPGCFVTPRRHIPDMVPEKFYRVIEIDVQELSLADMARMRNEHLTKRKFKPPSDTALLADRDDEDLEEEVRKKQSHEKEFFTVVWLLIGGNDRLECQWVNAEDVYFL